MEKSVSTERLRKGGGKQFIGEDLPQVLQCQMEKQLNQTKGNRLVVSSSLKIFIRTWTKVRQNNREEDINANDSFLKQQIKILSGFTTEWFDSEIQGLIN